MKIKTPVFLLLFFIFHAAFSDCVDGSIIPNVPLSFYGNSLGTYTIDLTATLNAATDGNKHTGNPFYEKKWYGECPGGLDADQQSCIEFTVYPNDQNFSPAGIMEKIEQYNDGNTNRGEVRIITNDNRSQYVYTTDHEATYCGPYNFK